MEDKTKRTAMGALGGGALGALGGEQAADYLNSKKERAIHEGLHETERKLHSKITGFSAEKKNLEHRLTHDAMLKEHYLEANDRVKSLGSRIEELKLNRESHQARTSQVLDHLAGSKSVRRALGAAGGLIAGGLAGAGILRGRKVENKYLEKVAYDRGDIDRASTEAGLKVGVGIAGLGALGLGAASLLKGKPPKPSALERLAPVAGAAGGAVLANMKHKTLSRAKNAVTEAVTSAASASAGRLKGKAEEVVRKQNPHIGEKMFGPVKYPKPKDIPGAKNTGDTGDLFHNIYMPSVTPPKREILTLNRENRNQLDMFAPKKGKKS